MCANKYFSADFLTKQKLANYNFCAVLLRIAKARKHIVLRTFCWESKGVQTSIFADICSVQQSRANYSSCALLPRIAKVCKLVYLFMFPK